MNKVWIFYVVFVVGMVLDVVSTYVGLEFFGLVEGNSYVVVVWDILGFWGAVVLRLFVVGLMGVCVFYLTDVVHIWVGMVFLIPLISLLYFVVFSNIFHILIAGGWL